MPKKNDDDDELIASAPFVFVLFTNKTKAQHCLGPVMAIHKIDAGV
jgi:hypothetical protein